MGQWIDFKQSLDQRWVERQTDADQEQLKNFRPNGHALIRGVAGSGKSLMLGDRATTLAKEFDRILVLSYNRFMNQWLKSNLAGTLEKKITATTFHSWAYSIGYSYEDDRQADQRQDAIALAKASGLQYDAILIDEAQDFYDEWFQALLMVLNPDTQSLFFVYDNTQAIYGQAHRRQADWSWKQLGINVAGRSQVFDINYRNAPEILNAAWNVMTPALHQANMPVGRRERDENGKVIKTPTLGTIIEPRTQPARSSGIKPLLLQVKRAAMAMVIAQQVKIALDGHPDSSIGILCHPNMPGYAVLQASISRELTAVGVEHYAPQTSQARNQNVVCRPFVLVDSWKAVKGLEFDAVIIVGADSIPELDSSMDSSGGNAAFEEWASLYVAMTRSRDHLVILYSRQTPLVDTIGQRMYASASVLE